MGVEYPYIVKAAKVCGGRAVIVGTRISVSSLVEYYQQGISFEELLDEFEYVPPLYIHAAFLYYYKHRGEIEKEIEQGQNEEFWQERYPGGKRLQTQMRNN
jgi:uncharacterized protein (DUF433 family)